MPDFFNRVLFFDEVRFGLSSDGSARFGGELISDITPGHGTIGGSIVFDDWLRIGAASALMERFL